MAKSHRGQQFEPSYLRHASGQAFVKVKGKHVYLGKYGTADSMRKYRELVAQLRQQAVQANPPPPLDDEPLVIDLVEHYLDWAGRFYLHGPHDAQRVLQMRRVLVGMSEICGSTVANRFGFEDFERWVSAQVPKGHSRTYVNSNWHVIKQMFRWACQRGKISGDAWSRVSSFRGLRKRDYGVREGKKRLPVSDEAVGAVLEEMSPTVRAMICLLRLTGMRPSEVFRLTPGLIDRASDIWMVDFSEHKTEAYGRQRIVPLTKEAQDVLTPFLDRGADECCFSPRENDHWCRMRAIEQRPPRKTKRWPCEQERVEREKRRAARAAARRPPLLGAQYTAGVFRRAIHRAIERVNRQRQPDEQIPRWSPYQIRHAVGTKMARKLGILAASQFLGHASVKTTAVYVHAMRDDLVEISQAWEASGHGRS